MGFINKLLGIPPVGSQHGEMVDHMLELVHWIMTALFVGWAIFLVIALTRFYRKNNPKADHTGVRGHASSHLELGVIITEIILLLGFAFPLWATQVDRFPNPDVRVNAWAEQFRWSFHYPGADGKFGRTDRFLISNSNPLGIDATDPNSFDDFVSSTLVLPKGKKEEIAVTSKDVIHNLALVSMRSAVDADPGKINRMWFIPTLAGKSDIVCGQLCGSGHGIMKGELEVLNDAATFADWEKQQQVVADMPFAAESVKKFREKNPKPAAAPAVAPAAPAAQPVAPAPTPAAPGGAATLELGVIPNVMQFDKKEMTVTAGQKVKLVFTNKACPLMHNFLLLKPGTKDAVGAKVDAMLSDPQALAKMYIPAVPEVLAHSSKLVPMGQADTIEFVAPSEPGDYPYICSFPGHWRLMNGVLKVTK